jgi:hypothetical protein
MQAHEIYGSIIQRKRQHISAYKNKKTIFFIALRRNS